MFIVVTEKGFLTGKKEADILETDNVIFETQNPNWMDVIHGKRKRIKYEENIATTTTTNSINNDRILTTITTEDNTR